MSYESEYEAYHSYDAEHAAYLADQLAQAVWEISHEDLIFADVTQSCGDCTHWRAHGPARCMGFCLRFDADTDHRDGSLCGHFAAMGTHFRMEAK